MRTTLRIVTVLTLVGFGYALGTMRLLEPSRAAAQQPAAETADTKIKAAYKALSDAQQALAQRGAFRGATQGVNAFAVTVGGVDAIRDLNEGRGVDPETFAALYAGEANDEVKKSLRMDDDRNVLTYKGKVVRMYSIDRLKKLFRKRDDLAGIKKRIPSIIKPKP
ncbi:MAG: hypothetical protein ACE5KM_13485 [Planctomycetaceae bacterium]